LQVEFLIIILLHDSNNETDYYNFKIVMGSGAAAGTAVGGTALITAASTRANVIKNSNLIDNIKNSKHAVPSTTVRFINISIYIEYFYIIILIIIIFNSFLI